MRLYKKLYDELIDPQIADRIVTAYNTTAQKMADLGFTSQGTVDKNAPLVIKEMQKRPSTFGHTIKKSFKQTCGSFAFRQQSCRRKNRTRRL